MNVPIGPQAGSVLATALRQPWSLFLAPTLCLCSYTRAGCGQVGRRFFTLAQAVVNLDAPEAQAPGWKTLCFRGRLGRRRRPPWHLHACTPYRSSLKAHDVGLLGPAPAAGHSTEV